MGDFAAFQADDGQRVWSSRTYNRDCRAPGFRTKSGESSMSQSKLAGVARSGWAAGELARDSQVNRGNLPRVLAFKLNGTDTLPAPPGNGPAPLEARRRTKASAAVVAQGKLHYHTHCGMCHGDSAVSGGVLPDLRYFCRAR